MAAYDSASFSTSAFSIAAFDFGSTPPAPVAASSSGGGATTGGKTRTGNRDWENHLREARKGQSEPQSFFDPDAELTKKYRDVELDNAEMEELVEIFTLWRGRQ